LFDYSCECCKEDVQYFVFEGEVYVYEYFLVVPEERIDLDEFDRFLPVGNFMDLGR